MKAWCVRSEYCRIAGGLKILFSAGDGKNIWVSDRYFGPWKQIPIAKITGYKF